uniref:TLC domain-containing protein n=1 Tax=Mycena chlorophos TaxID=658473 RepID=A0ABQ0LY50_MYCCL|nr:predicted protein [Mycena chlorophos]
MESVYAYLPKIRPHLPTLVASFSSFTLLQFVLVPLFGSLFFGDTWRKMSPRAKNNWAVHICSQAHAIVIIPLAWRVLDLPELNDDRAFGWHEASGSVQAVAAGYFMWDSLDAIVHFDNIGFVLHGLTCGAIYILSFTPYLSYYAARFLMWELSTLFLNVHWALDKTNRTGGSLQLINGVLLLVTFFAVRLVAGGYWSYQFYETLFQSLDRAPFAAILAPGIGNLILQGLNWFWFTKMIAALQKRFAGGSKKEKQLNGTAINGNGKHKED